MNSPEVVQADLSRPDHQQAILAMMDAYSRDPMGDGRPLAPEVRRNLIPGLQQHPTTLIFLAYIDGAAVGIVTCFRGFSTFRARPLINISDLHVLPQYQGQGIGHQLLLAVEQAARESGCCKLTLEVQEHNQKARHFYRAIGFAQDVHVSEAGGALFLSKPL